MTSSNTIKLSDNINPHFYKFWKSKKEYFILNGGRGSFKSSVVSLKLVTELKKRTQLNLPANVICIRENQTYLRDSVYAQITWAIEKLGLTDEFEFRTSPMRIRHRRTGNSFFFYGANDPMKLKSNIVGNVIAVWYEETANFANSEVFDVANPTFIRQKPVDLEFVPIYFTYNPPKNPFDWINKWVDSKRSNNSYFIDTSTYLDDELGFTTKQQLDLINEYKNNDYDYYRWLYLGEAIGLGNNVYNMNLFKSIMELPVDDEILWLAFSTDVGHQHSATAMGCYGITAKKNVIRLDTYYYSPAGRAIKKAPSDLAVDLNKKIVEIMDKFPNAQVINQTIDSAEGGLRNEYRKLTGVNWHPVAKKKNVDMIDFVQNLLAQGRFYYLDNEANQIFVEEHRKYSWDEKTLNSDDPKVIKEDDHTVDEFKYFVIDNVQLLGLVVYGKVV